MLSGGILLIYCSFWYHCGYGSIVYRHRGFQGSAASYAERSTLNKGESNSSPDVGEGVWVALFLLDANFFCQLFHDSTCWGSCSSSASKYNRVEAAVLDFADTVFIFQFFDLLVVFVCLLDLSRATLCKRVENLHIKKRSLKSLSPESICFDVRSSFLVRAGGFVVKSLPLQLLKHGLDLDVVANFIHQIGEGIPNLVVAHNCISAFGAVQGMCQWELLRTGAFRRPVYGLPAVSKTYPIPEVALREVEPVSFKG